MMDPRKGDGAEMKKPDPMTRIWIVLAGLGLFLLLWLIYRQK
jgi:hypothetical protein